MKLSRIPFLHPLLLGGLLCSAAAPEVAAQQVDASGAAVKSDAVENYVLPDYIRKPPVVPAQLGQRPRREMTLREAIELALRNNLQLELQRETVHQRDYQYRQSFGGFEPTLALSFSRNKQKSPPVTAQDGHAGEDLPTTSDGWSASLSQVLPTGTNLSLNFNNARTQSALGSAVEPLNYRASLQFALNQPLLQGFSFNGHIQQSAVLQAEFNSETARENARQTAISTVAQTEALYWSLVSSWKTYEVKRATFELAEKQVELTSRKIAAGTLPEADILQVQSSQAQKQFDLLTAQAALEDAADQLWKFLNVPAAQWEQILVPLDTPNFKPTEVILERVWDRALSFRPEIKLSNIDLQRDGLALEVARNGRLPQLNVKGSLGTIGQDSDYGAALQQVKSASGWQWMVGVDFNWAPLGVAARANVKSGRSAVRYDDLQRAASLAQIRYDLRSAKRNIETAERQVRTAARQRQFAERSLEAEERRFLNGMTDNLHVADRQTALDSARLNELTALIAHEKARSSLLQATGELLEARQLKFVVRTDD